MCIQTSHGTRSLVDQAFHRANRLLAGLAVGSAIAEFSVMGVTAGRPAEATGAEVWTLVAKVLAGGIPADGAPLT